MCVLVPLSIKRLQVTFTPMIIVWRLISCAMVWLHILNITEEFVRCAAK